MRRATRAAALLLSTGLALVLVRCDAPTPVGQRAKASVVPDVYVDTVRNVACYSFAAQGYVEGRSISCVKL